MSDEIDDAGDTEGLFTELAAASPGKYPAMDRFREFRQVFLGSDAGKRVLHQILEWGLINKSSAQVAHYEPYRTMFHDGQRSMGIKIMMTLNTEPKAQPDRANTQTSER